MTELEKKKKDGKDRMAAGSQQTDGRMDEGGREIKMYALAGRGKK